MTSNTSLKTIDKALLSLIQNLGMGEVTTIEPIAIEASTRRYYRLHLSGMPQTVILCDGLPKPNKDADHFIEISEFFSKRGYPCSQILINDADHGRLILEDAGTLDLSTAINNLSSQTQAEQRWNYIQRGLELLSPLQNFEAPEVIASRAFDSIKLQWEMDYFFTHLDMVCEYLKIENILTFEIKNFLSKLCDKLDQKEDLVICHRDYHGRNIILSDDSLRAKITIIDFQDARMGLPVYDATSLIYDPYTPLTLSERLKAKQLFESKLQPKHHKYQSYYYGQALQRLLKALGTYCHQIFIQGHEGYVGTVPSTINNLEEVIQLGHFPDSLYLFVNQFRQHITPQLSKILGKHSGGKA